MLASILDIMFLLLICLAFPPNISRHFYSFLNSTNFMSILQYDGGGAPQVLLSAEGHPQALGGPGGGVVSCDTLSPITIHTLL